MTAHLRVRVRPGAARAGLQGWMADGTLKLSVSAPPEDGRANQAVEELLAVVLGLERAAVRVARGARARVKWIKVEGLDEGALRSRITAALSVEEKRGE